MGFSTLNQLYSALSGATPGQRQTKVYRKASITAVAANYYSLWKAAGFPTAGVSGTPPACAVCTKDTVGALPILNPAVMRTLHLLPPSVGGTVLGGLIFYDRLLEAAINLTIDTLQTFTGEMAPRRYTDGVGNMLFLEMTTATTVTAATLTITYINTLGETKTATLSLAAAEVVDRCYFIDLAAGDVGIKSIVSAQLSAAKTGGQANLVLFNEAMKIPTQIVANTYTPAPVMDLPQVLKDACLAALVLASTTSTGVIDARVPLVEGGGFTP